MLMADRFIMGLVEVEMDRETVERELVFEKEKQEVLRGIIEEMSVEEREM